MKTRLFRARIEQIFRNTFEKMEWEPDTEPIEHVAMVESVSVEPASVTTPETSPHHGAATISNPANQEFAVEFKVEPVPATPVPEEAIEGESLPPPREPEVSRPEIFPGCETLAPARPGNSGGGENASHANFASPFTLDEGHESLADQIPEIDYREALVPEFREAPNRSD